MQNKKRRICSLSKYREKVYRSLAFVVELLALHHCDCAIGLHREIHLYRATGCGRTALWSAINFEIVAVKITRRFIREPRFTSTRVLHFRQRRNSLCPDVERQVKLDHLDRLFGDHFEKKKCIYHILFG